MDGLSSLDSFSSTSALLESRYQVQFKVLAVVSCPATISVMISLTNWRSGIA